MNKKTLNDNKSSASKISEKKQIMDDIRAKYAYEILNRLADEDAKISKRIEELAFEYLREVDPDDVADGVFHNLDSLEVEDVWDKSGGTRHGYVDPYELASEMFEDVLEPYLEELRKFQKLSMDEKAKLHCMGILKGIYKFEIDATTEFKDWSGDDPHVYFIQVFEEWEKGNKDLNNLEEMHLFIKKNCAKWYKDIEKKSGRYQ